MNPGTWFTRASKRAFTPGSGLACPPLRPLGVIAPGARGITAEADGRIPSHNFAADCFPLVLFRLAGWAFVVSPVTTPSSSPAFHAATTVPPRSVRQSA